MESSNEPKATRKQVQLLQVYKKDPNCSFKVEGFNSQGEILCYNLRGTVLLRFSLGRRGRRKPLNGYDTDSQKIFDLVTDLYDVIVPKELV